MYYKESTLHLKRHEITIFLKSQNLDENGMIPIKSKFETFEELISATLGISEKSLFQVAQSISEALHPYCYKVSIKTGNHLISYEK